MTSSLHLGWLLSSAVMGSVLIGLGLYALLSRTQSTSLIAALFLLGVHAILAPLSDVMGLPIPRILIAAIFWVGMAGFLFGVIKQRRQARL